MSTWYFPSCSGDFRLETCPEGGERTSLTVHDPSPVELDRLGRFLDVARRKGWVSKHTGISEKGESRLEIKASLNEAGRVLAGWHHRKKGVITAVSSEEGELIVVTEDKDQAAKVIPRKGKAVSVKRPTLCCPCAYPGAQQRASEVLRAFCSPGQWSDWTSKGWLTCLGGRTGFLYRICHRGHDLVKKTGRTVHDLDNDHIVHCYDWSVPPQEEALAAKLILEHREHWIRNPCGIFGAPMTFRNPLGHPYLDGVTDTTIFNAFGGFVMGGIIGRHRRQKKPTPEALRSFDQMLQRASLRH